MADFILSEQYIFGLLESSDLFPIDFDEAWQWVGYSRKDAALRVLKGNFEEGLDFSTNRWKTPSAGRPSEQYCLTVDCFEHFCLMTNTDKGRQVRQHFIECRRKYIAMLKQQSSQQQKLTPIQLIAALAQQMAEQEARVQQQQEQLDRLLANQAQAYDELTALPYSEQPAPEKSTRAKINQIVRNYVSRTNVEYRSVWQQLYKELYYRCGVNVSIRAKHRNTNLLDVVEEDGLIEQLHAIATETLK